MLPFMYEYASNACFPSLQLEQLSMLVLLLLLYTYNLYSIPIVVTYLTVLTGSWESKWIFSHIYLPIGDPYRADPG